MGNFWSNCYLLINGQKNKDSKGIEYYIIPDLVQKSVDIAYKELLEWFDEYKIISIQNIGYTDVSLERKKIVVIFYSPSTNLVSKVEIYN